jgi:hypothetical protein
MHLDVIKDSPFRRPAWRSERAFEMLTHRPRPLRPRRSDDQYVRAYYWYMQNSLAAGDDAVERQHLHREMPHVGQAHWLYSSDVEQRQILEARLLTSETFDEIAERFVTAAQTIECFEQLFFNVRDRMQATDWLIKAIQGPHEDRARSRDGVMTPAQRGFAYRHFAYFGGPLILDAVVMCLSRQQDEDSCLDEATRDVVSSRAALATSLLVVDGQNVMRLLKLALRENPVGSAVPNQMSATDREIILRELQNLLGPIAAETASS